MIGKSSLKKLKEGIERHIQIYPNLSVKAEQFESLFAYATDSKWEPYNHNPGEDMVTNYDGLRKPSLKSGVITNNVLTISSHRTTKYKTLDDKIKFLSNVPYDSYICLARPKNGVHNYKLIHFPKSLIDYSLINWEVTFSQKGHQTGWKGSNENGTIQLRISKSMSDQLWIDIHESLVTIIEEFNYDVTQ